MKLTALAPLLFAAGTAYAQGPAVQGTPQMDWCSPVVVRPESRWDRDGACAGRKHEWTEAEIARHASVVYLYGGTGEAFATGTDEPQAEIGETCFGYGTFGAAVGSPNEADYLEYASRITAMRPASMPALKWVIAFRWDLVSSKQLGSNLDTFDTAWLWRTDPADATPYTTLLNFWANDSTSVCGGGSTDCYWDERQLQYGTAVLPGGAPDCGTNSSKRCLKELINLAAGEDPISGTDYEDAVYYVELSRDSSVFSRGWTTSAVGRQDISGYRNWKMALAQEAIADLEAVVGAGNVYIDLNNKYHFWFSDAAGNSTTGVPASTATPDETGWLGSDYCETVLERWSVPCEWSGKPDFSTLSYSAYVQGVKATADLLNANGVKYAYLAGALDWCASSPTCTTNNQYNDEIATGGVDEAELRRDIAEDCTDCLVLLDVSYGNVNWNTDAGSGVGSAIANVVTQIEAGSGNPTIILGNNGSSPTYCPGRDGSGYMPVGFGKQRGVTGRGASVR